MEESHSQPTNRRTDPSDLFESPIKETHGDRIKSMLSSHAEPTFTVTLEILTVTAAVVIVLLIVVFYMGFLRGRDVERRDIARKVSELKSRQAESYQIQRARTQFIPQPIVPVSAPPVRRTTMAPQVKTAVPAASIPPKSVAISPRKPYTVQVVTYRSQSRAQSEVTQLSQKGYAARMIVRGALYVVCVGEYSGRYDAQKDLRALKRIYPDSYLRKF
jgi:cell division septation protein DedD